MNAKAEDPTDLLTTPLDGFHRRHQAKMVPFAGHAMPIQYEPGIMAEHRHTRAQAGLFDVSHMGQAFIHGGDGAVAALERVVPGDIAGLAPGHVRYTMFTNDAGGILDDLMVTNLGDRLFVVVNASRRDHDFGLLAETLADDGELELRQDHALIALQGPAAADVLHELAAPARLMSFMSAAELHINVVPCLITRSGYTGEDGYEISVPADAAEDLAELLAGDERVMPIGLGARDTLRLEAGLCLYGNDIDETTTPIEAGLRWTIGPRRREQGGFAGADVILGQIANGPERRRVGLKPDGAAPAREGTEIATKSGNIIGHVTSGGFGPSVDGPIAMGYVTAEHAAIDTEVDLLVRGKPRPGRIVRMPFTEHHYFKG